MSTKICSLINSKYTASRTPRDNCLRAVGMLQAESILSATARQFVVTRFYEHGGIWPKLGQDCWPAQTWLSQSNHSSPRPAHHPFAPKEPTVACHCRCWQHPWLCRICGAAMRRGLQEDELHEWHPLRDQHCSLTTVLLILRGWGSTFAPPLLTGDVCCSPTNQASSCPKLMVVSMSNTDVERDMQTTALCSEFHKVVEALWCWGNLLHNIALKWCSFTVTWLESGIETKLRGSTLNHL